MASSQGTAAGSLSRRFGAFWVRYPSTRGTVVGLSRPTHPAPPASGPGLLGCLLGLVNSGTLGDLAVPPAPLPSGPASRPPRTPKAPAGPSGSSCFSVG